MDTLNLESLTANFVDTFPQLKRSTFVEAFQQDYGILTSELSRIKIMSIHQKNFSHPIMSLLANAAESTGKNTEEGTDIIKKAQIRKNLLKKSFLPPKEKGKPLSYYGTIVESLNEHWKET
jgi:hypothetical protein